MKKGENPRVLMVDGSFNNEGEEVNYRGLVHKFFLGKWYLYLVSLALCLGLAYVYLKKKQPVYEITGKLLIRERPSDYRYSPEEDWLKRSLGFSAVSENVANEIQVLTSSSLMDSVVEDLGLNVRYYWKHEFSEYDAYQNFPILVDTFFLKQTEKNGFQITVEKICAGDLKPGMRCDDGDPCTAYDVVQADCSCAGVFQDSDHDGVCDAEDICPGGPEPGMPCDDGDPATDGEVIKADCSCANDKFDCPVNQANIGDPCDDGDPATKGDVIREDCSCSGLAFTCSRVERSSDDAEEWSSGNVAINSSDLEMVNDKGEDQIVGMRFVDLHIPPGARIISAYIQFVVDETVNHHPCDLNIYGEASDDAATFMAVKDNISRRDRTLANVSWSPSNWQVVGDAGPAQRTPDIASIIQEIVNRDGYSSNSSIAIIIQGTGTRIVESYDGISSLAPELCVQYDPSNGNFDCPDLQANIGAPCDDGDPCTANDVVQADCGCAGVFQSSGYVGECDTIGRYSFRFSQDDSEIGRYEFGQLFTNEYGTFRIRRNESLPLSSDSTMHVAFNNPKAVAGSYLNNLEVSLSDEKNNSSVLLLKLRDVVPQRGVDVLNGLVEKYNQLKAEENSAITLNSLEFIKERLGAIRKELNSVESRVEEFKRENEIHSETTADLEIILNNVYGLIEEQQDIEVQMSILNSIKRDLQDNSSNFELIPVNLSLVNTQIQELVKPYNELVLQRKQYLMTSQPSNPLVQSVNQKLNSLRSSIFAAIDNMQHDLKLKLDMAKIRYEESRTRLRSVPGKERGLSDKLRDQGITEDLYAYLLKKREEIALALISNYSSSILVDPPHSTLQPVAPNKLTILLGGTLFGIAIPLCLLLIIDLFKDSIQTEKELKQLMPDQSIVGVINHHRGKKRQVLLRQNRNLVAERFRTLRTNINFHHPDKTKCIMVTSSTSEEGKTFVATNLATSFALFKKKTVVLDFDLRNPNMIRYLDENPEVGLSNFLIGQLEIEEIIRESKTSPNLHYIAGGPVLPNPVEWVSEEKLAGLFSYLQAHYDIIIVDTPPVGVVSDAILLNKYMDHSLFVIRSGFTKKEMVEKAKEFFDQNKLTNPSLILNGVKKRNDVYGYNYKNIMN